MTVYQIRVQGHLPHAWATWFEGFTLVQAEHGETVLTGPVVDQAALFGILRRVRDLGLPLVAVHRIPSGPASGPFDSNSSEET
jgi:hypothetical protein